MCVWVCAGVCVCVVVVCVGVCVGVGKIQSFTNVVKAEGTHNYFWDLKS